MVFIICSFKFLLMYLFWFPPDSWLVPNTHSFTVELLKEHSGKNERVQLRVLEGLDFVLSTTTLHNFYTGRCYAFHSHSRKCQLQLKCDPGRVTTKIWIEVNITVSEDKLATEMQPRMVNKHFWLLCFKLNIKEEKLFHTT